MKYAALIYGNEAQDSKRSPQELQEEMAAYGAFGQHAGAAIVGGEALNHTGTATTVRVKDGKITTTDGPFAETQEQLGGFYLLECDNLDEAIALAAKIPHASYGAVEIRPVMVFE